MDFFCVSFCVALLRFSVSVISRSLCSISFHGLFLLCTHEVPVSGVNIAVCVYFECRSVCLSSLLIFSLVTMRPISFNEIFITVCVLLSDMNTSSLSNSSFQLFFFLLPQLVLAESAHSDGGSQCTESHPELPPPLERTGGIGDSRPPSFQ